MNSQQRSIASSEQTLRFFQSYYPYWRIAKIKINEKILREKYSFLASIKDIKRSDEDSQEALIAQELSNGLILDSISNCIQYIEDLFALLKAGKRRDFFIKEIVTYQAGQIDNFILKDPSEKEILALFYFPYIDPNKYPALQDNFRSCLDSLMFKLEKIKDYYSTFKFFYTQYKHGLTVGLRFQHEYIDEQVMMDKLGDMPPWIAAFDNVAITVHAKKRGLSDAIIIPALGPNIDDLQKENNLLRFIMTPRGMTHSTHLECAELVQQCMRIFISNFCESHYDRDDILLCLPGNGKSVCQFSLDRKYIKNEFPISIIDEE